MSEPQYRQQENEFGHVEFVDITIYSHTVLCQYTGCCRIRYVKPQDSKQVKYCKVHAAQIRREYRAAHAKKQRRLKSEAK